MRRAPAGATLDLTGLFTLTLTSSLLTAYHWTH